MTPDMLRAWQQGRLDARCTQCGETYPARRQCLHCGSTDMEYREHVGSAFGESRDAQWCQTVKYPRQADPTNPRTGVRRGARRVSPEVNATPALVALSSPTGQREMGL